uniref:CD58 molecule n=1 Tax=Chrysemys picta bellii TaxID=8478 RepID=A0A8C3F9D9_CHRPI|nr:lymphocyte function-associated antigen 3 isoform X2 [Chrysemys picta bellii]
MGLACRLSALGLLLSALLVCTRSQDRESVFAIVGEDFTFSPKVNGTIREITWMKNKDKAAEWEQDAKSPVYYYSLAERGVLETSSGNLTIKKLNIGDAAEYEAQVLPVGVDQLQYTKFVLAVLDPPPPSVLNCSITNGQIRISCEIQFSKDVRYSWYRDDRKIDANSPVLELKGNVNPSEKVLCVREVSKTKINNSISLSTCIPENPESLSRGRAGLIAFFVIIIILLLFMGALVVLWKRGLLSNILDQIPTKHSAVYKSEEQHLTDDDRFPEESGQKEEEKKNSKESLSMNQADNSSNQEKTEEKKKSKETLSTNQDDNSSNQENPDYENISGGNQEPEEKKNSKESLSMSQADHSFNQEKTDLKLESETD